MPKRSLFVCYCKLNSSHDCMQYPVFCRAFSYSHAKQLAFKFCVDIFYWDYDSFSVSDPIIINSFIQ